MDYSPTPPVSAAVTEPGQDTAPYINDFDDAFSRQQSQMLRRCQQNLSTVLADAPECRDMDITQLLRGDTDTASCCHIQHWAGGVYAYTLALQSLAPPHTTQPSPLLQGAIERAFGSQAGLCRTLQNAAPGQAGFVWLSSDREGRLQVNRTFQYATPLPLTPLLALPAACFPTSGICARLNFSAASRRYGDILAQRTPNLFV